MQIAIEQQREDFKRRIRLKSITAELLQQMAEAHDLLDGLQKCPRELMAFADASGVALVNAERCATVGDCPPEAAIRNLVDWLLACGRQEVFSSDSLATVMPGAQAMADYARRARHFYLESSPELHTLVPTRSGANRNLVRRSA